MEALREQKRPSAMFMLDVDVFKDVNDHHGHDVGDQVLVEIVQMARLTLRKTDLFGRLGGDEFAGLLLDADTAQAFAMLDRLRSKLASIRIEANKDVVSFTASIGMTSISLDDTYESALKRADEALYKAKETGRNRVFIGAH
jgi:diguanylate cyclase (GGDEF)-like protein